MPLYIISILSTFVQFQQMLNLESLLQRTGRKAVQVLELMKKWNSSVCTSCTLQVLTSCQKQRRPALFYHHLLSCFLAIGILVQIWITNITHFPRLLLASKAAQSRPWFEIVGCSRQQLWPNTTPPSGLIRYSARIRPLFRCQRAMRQIVSQRVFD